MRCSSEVNDALLQAEAIADLCWARHRPHSCELRGIPSSSGRSWELSEINPIRVEYFERPTSLSSSLFTMHSIIVLLLLTLQDSFGPDKRTKQKTKKRNRLAVLQGNVKECK